MKLVRLLACVLAVVGAAGAQAAPVNAANEEGAIRTVLARQAADWNRGDLDAYATGYKKSPEILFIGTTVSRGYDGMLASYRKKYSTKQAMGVLTFTHQEVHVLDARFAEAIGNFHLERTAAGGGNADGVYSLILEKTAAGWKIVLDHSSSTTPTKAS